MPRNVVERISPSVPWAKVKHNFQEGLTGLLLCIMYPPHKFNVSSFSEGTKSEERKRKLNNSSLYLFFFFWFPKEKCFK